ncbi:MAG TPA: FG-GAP repeat protein, partial [Thermoanaerobaculia bacterium]
MRSASPERVDYDYGAITEWWTNSIAGPEHGFDVRVRPSADRSQPLVLRVAVGNGWSVRADDRGLRFDGDHGERLAYGKLATRDARGRLLAGRLRPSGGGFTIEIDDREAVYPLTVDPLLTNLQAKLEGISIGGEEWAQFGASVSISGNTAVIGAPWDDTAAGIQAGNAYVFVRDGETWTQQAQLASSGIYREIYFGTSVAISGDTIVVGAPIDVSAVEPTGEVRGGTAYVFVRNGTTWTQQARLSSSAGVKTSLFGSSVAIDADTILVGSYGDTTLAASGGGSVFVFLRSGTNWAQQARITDTVAPNNGDGFGYSVALDGDTAVIGAWHDDPNGGNAGSAFVYVRSGTTWNVQAQLIAPATTEQSMMGSAVAVDGDTAVVGAPGDSTAASNTGSAHVFVRSGTTWAHQAELVAADASVNDQFGNAVALEGDVAVIGAAADDTAAGLGAGSVYLFVRSGTTWAQQAQLFHPDGEPQDGFGISVDIDAGTVLIGCNGDRTAGGEDAGSAFVFVNEGGSWIEQAYLQPTGRASSDHFGRSVAIDGDTAIVGTFGDDTSAGTNA